ncbi:MAG: hypothetical protein DHS20C14_14390 [Phycisphaeraceae bacterium]|nr:MAG: hypothetical protein DHS20C14_14390 [Phycisphaeraceae bacterium]
MLTKSVTHTCLFGGAMFAAGVAQGEPAALTLGNQTAYFATAYGTPFFETGAGPLGIGAFGYGVGDVFGLCSIKNDEILIRHERASSGTVESSIAYASVIFYGLEDALVELDWDHGDWETIEAYVRDNTTGVTIFDFAAFPVPGAPAYLQLFEGHQYRLRYFTLGEAPGGDAFVRLTPDVGCAADIDGNGVLNVDDIGAFVAAFLGGCDAEGGGP